MARMAWPQMAAAAGRALALGTAWVALAASAAYMSEGRVAAQTASPANAHEQAVAGINELVEAGLPRGIWIPAELQPAVRQLLMHSPTFREQCARLASYPSVHIGVIQDSARLRDRRCGGLAEIRRYRSGVVAVIMVVPRSDKPYEILAHEMEHVLEFLEGVSHRALAASAVRPHEVWTTVAGVETRRAIDAGRKALVEMNRPVIMTSADKGSFWK
jgi:hypothetical protein